MAVLLKMDLTTDTFQEFDKILKKTPETEYPFK